VDQTKEYLVQKEEHDTVATKPRLRGIHRLRFQRYAHRKPVSEPVEGEIEGLPGDLLEKHKHYYINSMMSNWGKSYNMDRLLEKFLAAYVPDYKNAFNIPPNVQFLVFDEYSATKAIPLEQLKSLASSNAQSGYLNRKSHGASYKPPKDVQIIILSNYSPYEVNASWDKKFQRKVISDEVLTTFDTRFHTVRLDNAEQRRQWMSPTSWTEEVFQLELRGLRDKCLKGKDDRVETVEFIATAVQMYKARTTHGKSLQEFVEACLWDGNDILLARLVYHDNFKRVKELRLDEWRREAFFECGNDRKNNLPVSPEQIHRGLMRLRAEIGEFCLYQDQWYLDAAITYPREYPKYLNGRVLIERPEPHMTEEDVATICMKRGRKRHHSECSGNFRHGGRIICDDAADEIDTDLIDDFDMWRCANAINKIRKITYKSVCVPEESPAKDKA
jgi:hypothetical protein